MSARGDAGPRPRHHAVQFSRTDENLYTTVGCFLAEGLIFSDRCAAIATPDHRDGILENLIRRHIDSVRAIRAGSLVLLDASSTLDQFMRQDAPDWDLFEPHVRQLLDRLSDGHPQRRVRLYGEGVDLLWRRGQTDAAVMLESFWNRVSVDRNLAILCSYAEASFYGEMQQLERVCAQHSHIVVSDRNVMHFPTRATETE